LEPAVLTPFDAVLVIAFGGPQGRDDIRPFLENVLRGRPIPPGRLEAVAHHYERFDGVSPLTELTMRQAAGLEERLRAAGHDLPVHVGMRNWHPLLPETLRRMADLGVRRAIGFIAAAHHSYSGCLQYKQNVEDARAELRREGRHPIEVTYVPGWHDHGKFVDANANRVAAALAAVPGRLQRETRVVFTAHSIPVTMAERYPYERELATTARGVADRLGLTDWDIAYQSRSGRPEDPWLGPDICDYLRAEHASGLRSVVLSPIGFLCDHVEVLYDLDHEARTVCDELGIAYARAQTVNDHPRFLEMMADVVLATAHRYARARPLVLTAGSGQS
jgi:ferrochelatase